MLHVILRGVVPEASLGSTGGEAERRLPHTSHCAWVGWPPVFMPSSAPPGRRLTRSVVA